MGRLGRDLDHVRRSHFSRASGEFELTLSSFHALLLQTLTVSETIVMLLQGADRWSNDLCFGAQRLIGCNPTMIRLCNALPEK